MPIAAVSGTSITQELCHMAQFLRDTYTSPIAGIFLTRLVVIHVFYLKKAVQIDVRNPTVGLNWNYAGLIIAAGLINREFNPEAGAAGCFIFYIDGPLIRFHKGMDNGQTQAHTFGGRFR